MTHSAQDSATRGKTERPRFTSLVVALNLDADGDRALPVVRSLAALGNVSVELLTVAAPRADENVVRYELGRRAAIYGWPQSTSTVLHDDQPARAIADHVNSRDGALLVMATAARSPLTGRIVRSVPAEVLGLIDGPVLLVGPRVPADVEIGRPTLVVCVDPHDVGDTAVPVITAWTNTFRSAQPRIAEVFSTVASPANDAAAADPSQAQRYATLLAAEGVTASATRLVGADPDVWLQDFADQITEPIFVATSVRWTDGQRHLHSTTQRLVRRSFGPVLVVPGRRSRTAEGEDERREDGQPLRIPGDDRTSSPHHASHEPPTTGEGSDPGDRFAVEDVTPESCWELLRSMSVGRLATYASGRPHIVPVNFVVDGRTIVFRTAEGAKLSAARDAQVAFEIDDYDAASGYASSVVVTGRATEIAAADEFDGALGLPLFPWHCSPKGHFVRITPDGITGRRFFAPYAGPDGFRSHRGRGAGR